MSKQSLIPVYTHLSYIILVLLVLPQMLALVKQGRYLFNPYNVKNILVWLKLYHSLIVVCRKKPKRIALD